MIAPHQVKCGCFPIFVKVRFTLVLFALPLVCRFCRRGNFGMGCPKMSLLDAPDKSLLELRP